VEEEEDVRFRLASTRCSSSKALYRIVSLIRSTTSRGFDDSFFAVIFLLRTASLAVWSGVEWSGAKLNRIPQKGVRTDAPTTAAPGSVRRCPNGNGLSKEEEVTQRWPRLAPC
jgi:hypothetical protein